MPPRQTLEPLRTAWHITWGTYGARLHGGARPTVDKDHNQRGEPFVGSDRRREEFMQAILNFPPVRLSIEQRRFAESHVPEICRRGGWGYRAVAAGGDHVHLLCDVKPEVHGEKVRRLVKRWLGQALSAIWPLPSGATWWAEEGSNIAIHDEGYLNNAVGYVLRQRTKGENGGD